MTKRILDFCLASIGLIILSPLLLVLCCLVWLQDLRSPFYIAPRVCLNGKLFNMIKLCSMVVDADKNKVDSTSANDQRITKIGKFIRKYKLDEVSQLINVLIGNMSLVGPRPNVKRETDLYTNEEKKLLTVKPGITDFASIVFADEGEILKNTPDPDISYHQLIRPWKSRLGLVYIEHQSLLLDFKLIFLTILAFISRRKALTAVSTLLKQLRVSKELQEIALRNKPLIPTPPPGTNKIITSRNL